MMYLGLMFTIAVMFNTMIMNVAERDFELATLRVLGASTRSLGTMLLFESLLIGIIGGVVGVAFAYGGAVGLAASFSSWQFFVPIVVVPSVAVQLMAGVIVIAVAMTPIGVWRLREWTSWRRSRTCLSESIHSWGDFTCFRSWWRCLSPAIA